MRAGSLRHLLIGCACLALAACGGGGGGGGGGTDFIPPPPPAPTPTPTPSPNQAVLQIFPNVAASTQFAALGHEVNRAETPTLTSDGFSVHYDGSSGTYVVDVPSSSPGTLYEFTNDTPNATWWAGEFVDSTGWPTFATVLKPTNPELALTYTTIINYDTSGMSPEPFGWLAFGVATQAGAVPVSGSATYAALIRGSSFDANGYIRGSGELSFDFAAGQLSGHLDPEYAPLGGMGESYALGRYDFVNTIFGVGSTGFSGGLAHSTLALGGSFNGQFTGSTAEELMGRWTATFRHPESNTDSQMFGVFVGRR